MSNILARLYQSIIKASRKRSRDSEEIATYQGAISLNFAVALKGWRGLSISHARYPCYSQAQ